MTDIAWAFYIGVVFFVAGTAWGYWICERTMNHYKEDSIYWNNKYMDAIRNFRELVDFVTEKKDKTK